MTPSRGEGNWGHRLSLPCSVLEGKNAGAGSDPLSLLLDKVCGHTHPGHVEIMPQRHLQVKQRAAGHFPADRRWQRDTVLGARLSHPTTCIQTLTL